MTWTSGSIDGGGDLIIPLGANLYLSGSTVYMYTRTIQNSGITTWSGTGEIYSGFGSVFNNLSGGLFDIKNDRGYSFNLGGAVATVFNNSGTLRKSAGAATTTWGVNFDNSGASGTPSCADSIDVLSGTINFAAGFIACTP